MNYVFDGNAIRKPWGFERLIYVGLEYAVKVLTMNKGEACSLQYHRKKRETIFVIDGELGIEINGESKIYHAGEAVTIAPGDRHRMYGSTDASYLECSTPELNDVVRIEDKYGRV